MAVIDIDRHILMEIVILQASMIRAAGEFKQQWAIITSVRDKTELIVLGEKNAEHTELPKLRNQIFRAMKICNTKMIYMDDCMSKTQALIKHMVSEVLEADTGKGTESGNHMD